jgi:hypothetical protein
MKRRNHSLVHCHFLLAKEGHGKYRFCKTCYSNRDPPSSLQDYAQPGKELPGCIKRVGGSTGIMKKHVECHGIVFGKASRTPQAVAEDESLTMEFTHDAVLHDLNTISVTSKTGAARFFRKRLPGLGGRLAIRRSIRKWRQRGNEQVKFEIDELKRQGVRVSLGADAWRSKGSSRRHYSWPCLGGG